MVRYDDGEAEGDLGETAFGLLTSERVVAYESPVYPPRAIQCTRPASAHTKE
jgi:hypothetical protein